MMRKWLLLGACLVAASPRAAEYERVSDGAFADLPGSDFYSSPFDVSADGRYLVIASAASNLVANDTNGRPDILLFDLVGGTRQIVAPPGISLNGDAGFASISADGAYVALESRATNFGVPDTNGFDDIYLWERGTGTFTRVAPAGVEPNGASEDPQLSSDGSKLVFTSAANNLGPADTNGVQDIYVFDRIAGTFSLASVSSAGVQGNVLAFDSTISADGQCVAFTSSASTLAPGDAGSTQDVFVRNLGLGTTVAASTSAAGVYGNGFSNLPTIGADCSYVAFMTTATNLVTTTDAYGRAVYVKDLVTGTPTRVWPRPISTAAMQSDGVTASASGAYLVFSAVNSGATSIVRWHKPSGTYSTPVPVTGLSTFDALPVPDDGSSVHYASTAPFAAVDRNVIVDVGRLQFSDSSLTWTSTPDPGQAPTFAGNGSSGIGFNAPPADYNGRPRSSYLSGDGRLLVFASVASNLVANDTNDEEDVFLHDRATRTTSLLSKGVGGVPANGMSMPTDISHDGRFVAFESCASNLVAGDTNGVCDQFLLDRQTGVTERINVATGGTQADLGGTLTSPACCHFGSVSNDGRHVAFASRATNLIAVDTNNADDVFLRDRNAGTTIRISRNSNGTQTSGASREPVITPDGSLVVFRAPSSTVPGGSGGCVAVDTTTLAVEAIALNSAGAAGLSCQSPQPSDDGRYVAFMGFGTNLVPGASPNGDVYLRDRLSARTFRVSLLESGLPATNPFYTGGFAGNATTLAFTTGNFGNESFVFDLGSGASTRVTPASNMTQVLRFGLSGDGRVGVLSSYADFAPVAGTGGMMDVFAVTRLTPFAGSGATIATGTLLNDPGGDPNDELGADLAIAGDLVALAAPGAGEVKLFARPTAMSIGELVKAMRSANRRKTLSLVATITASTSQIGDKFGAAIALGADGNRLVIGSPLAGGGEGRVFVYDRPSGGWTSTATPGETLVPTTSGGVVPQAFGSDVAIGTDHTLVVGAPLSDVSDAADAGWGAVYRPQAGAYGATPSDTLQATTPQAGASFGAAVALTSGNLVIGAPREDHGGALDDGAVYVYRNAAGVAPVATLTPAQPALDGNKFGSAVAIHGGVMVVGAPAADTARGAGSGSAIVYEFTTPELPPTMRDTLLPVGTGAAGAGAAVAISGDYVAVGAPLSARQAIAGSGAVFVYERPAGGWVGGIDVTPAEVRAAEIQAGQAFGRALALSDQNVIVGAPARDLSTSPATSEANRGEAEAFVFDRILRSNFE